MVCRMQMQKKSARPNLNLTPQHSGSDKSGSDKV